MAAEVGEQRRQLVVGDVGDAAPADRASASGSRADQALAELVAGQADQRLVLLVAHVVDPPAQRLAAGPGEDGLQPAAVLGLEHLPAAVAEQRLELARPGCRG